MQYRTLGSSGLSLSVIGLGTWAIGGGDWKFGWGDQDESEAIAAIVRAVELGINWIDTAAIYGEGRSEILVARAMEAIPVNDRPLIATKCGRVALGGGEIGKCLKRDSVIRECEASLKRLNTDCIDLYQMHWPEPDEEIEEGWQTLVDLKAEGRIRHIGVSNHSVSQLQRLQAIHPVASLQPPYSMIARDVEAEILPYCGSQNIGVICYSPMGKGLLTGTFTAERAAALSTKDHRSRDPRFQSPQLEINLTFVSRLTSIATDLGWSVSELALAWVLRREEMTAAIVGARRPEQIEQTAMAGDRVLEAAAIRKIEEALAERDRQLSELGEVTRPRV
ncbi:MAG: aldo/keto reductase [Planctomycetaceae bacterium]|nr:aldo/keto reductase [Planctomycetaceae bacterium]